MITGRDQKDRGPVNKTLKGQLKRPINKLVLIESPTGDDNKDQNEKAELELDGNIKLVQDPVQTRIDS